MDNKFAFSVSRRTLRRALMLAVVIAMLAPVAVFAAGGTFVDDDNSIFEGDIEWMATNGITSGCGPDTYCPEDNVTRGQMAAFMKRLAQKKVVDAATAVSADTALQANNSALLGGQPPNLYRSIVVGKTCSGGGCTDATGLTNVNVMQLTITAPVAGVLSLNATSDLNIGGPSNEYVASWMTLNGDSSSFAGCEGSFLGVPIGAHRVIGSDQLSWLDGNVFHANLAASPVVAVPAGTHVVRLCVFGSANVDTWSAALSATWNSEGTATIMSTGPTSAPDIAPELVALLEAATEN